MTLVEGDTGVIVIDPLISAEVAAAGLALYREHRGERAVTAVLYTHSHIDHFGGVMGVVDADTDVPIIAPAHFMDHAVSENVYAGGAMLRRGMYYTGTGLPVSATGVVGVGLGAAASTGSVGLLAPTLDITHTGQEETIDGVRLVFQMTPGTEAPSELNLHLPGFRALCMAENATHNLHNILTLRGAEVRDARNWSRYIAEAVELFVDDSDVAFASHHWPTWGTDAIRTFLTEQRDLYLYLHDQTLRMLNQGYVGSEIAERLEVPPGPRLPVAHPRLLRLGQPQRQGHLPALSRLVRREPCAPLAAPAGGGRPALRLRHRRHRCDRRQGPGVRGCRRPPLCGGAGEPRRLRGAGARRRYIPSRRRAHPPWLRGRVRNLAQLLPPRCPGGPR